MDEARRAVATALASLDDYVLAELPVDEGPNYLITDQQRYLRMADVFVAEIAAAGYVIVQPVELRAVITQLAAAEHLRDSSGMIRAWAAIDGMLGDLEGTS